MRRVEDENIKNCEPFMLNLFFMLRLFFHFFPQQRGFSELEWVSGCSWECAMILFFFSFPISPLPSFCVQKLLFSLDLFFQKKKITESFFYYLNVVHPPSLNHRATASSHATLYLFFYSLRFFFLGRNEKIHF